MVDRREVSRGIRVIQFVWIAGFLVGTTTHVADLVLGGLDTYYSFPAGTRLFWVSLTLLDPLAVILIVARARAGVALGVAIMIADVSVNWSIFATVGGLGVPGLVSQSLFCGFVLVTARALWRAFGRRGFDTVAGRPTQPATAPTQPVVGQPDSSGAPD